MKIVVIYMHITRLRERQPSLVRILYKHKPCVIKFICCKFFSLHLVTFYQFLAHLSRRLIGELIVYPWSGVLRPSVRRRPSSTMLKHLLLRNRLADQSQILCGASLGRENEILFAASGSHDQDGRHAHIWQKPFKIFFSRTGGRISTKLGMQHLGLQPIIVCSNDDPRVTLTYFTARSNLVT